MWGTDDEVPSFLYAMPSEDGRQVFLEETCLVAKPALPFAILKRRLERRLAAMGIKVTAPACLPCTPACLCFTMCFTNVICVVSQCNGT